MKKDEKYFGIGEPHNPDLHKLTPAFKRKLISHKCHSIDEILYCEAKGSYTLVYLSNDKNFMVSMNLRETCDVLPKDDFARCHRSYLINLNHVRDIMGPSPCKAVLSGGKVLDVSVRRKRDLFSQWLIL